MGRIGTTELLLVLGIALVIFGPTKLPQLGKALGDTIHNFKASAESAKEKAVKETSEVKSD